jgi:hypothetical protein
MAAETETVDSTTTTDLRPEVYDNYEAFLRQGVREYYDRGWKARKGNFIALVIASGQIVGMATDSIKDGSGLRKAAIGAASVVALRLGLKYFLSGPLGIVLSAAMIGSAVAYLVKNQREIAGKVGPYRELIEDTRSKFEEIQGGYRAGKYDAAGRNLMVQGLLKGFLDQVDVVKPASAT